MNFLYGEEKTVPDFSPDFTPIFPPKVPSVPKTVPVWRLILMVGEDSLRVGAAAELGGKQNELVRQSLGAGGRGPGLMGVSGCRKCS